MRFHFRLLPLILAAFMAFCGTGRKVPIRAILTTEIIDTYENISKAWLPIPIWNWWT